MNYCENLDEAFIVSAVMCEGGDQDHYTAEEASLVERSIADLYNDQPPFWYSRTKTEDQTARITKEMPTPMGRPGDFNARGRSNWNDHVQDVREFSRKITTGNWATNFELEAMSKIMVRGVEHGVGVINSTIQISHYPSPTFAKVQQEGLRLPVGTEYTDATFLSFEEFEEIFRKDLFGRRFWTVKFNFTNQKQEGMHWATGLFDRQSQSFLYFDTQTHGRCARAKAAALSWRAFLSNIRMPYNFYFYSTPISNQPDTWSCGPLSLFLLFQAVRSHVGYKLFDIFDNHPQRHVLCIDGRITPVYPPEALDILTRDWPDFGETPECARDRIIMLFLGMCADETGDALPPETVEPNGSQFLVSSANSYDLGGQVPMPFLDGAAHVSPAHISRLFPKRVTNVNSTDATGWRTLPSLQAYNAIPPVADSYDGRMDKVWKMRNNGTIPPALKSLVTAHPTDGGKK